MDFSVLAWPLLEAEDLCSNQIQGFVRPGCGVRCPIWSITVVSGSQTPRDMVWCIYISKSKVTTTSHYIILQKKLRETSARCEMTGLRVTRNEAGWQVDVKAQVVWAILRMFKQGKTTLRQLQAWSEERAFKEAALDKPIGSAGCLVDDFWPHRATKKHCHRTLLCFKGWPTRAHEIEGSPRCDLAARVAAWPGVLLELRSLRYPCRRKFHHPPFQDSRPESLSKSGQTFGVKWILQAERWVEEFLEGSRMI